MMCHDINLNYWCQFDKYKIGIDPPPIPLILTTYAIPGYFQVYKNIEFLFLHTEIRLKLLDVHKSNNPH